MHSEDGFGGICVGVCDAEARVSFGLCLYNGYVGMNSRSPEGNVVTRVDSISLFQVAHVVLEPQKFWWDLRQSQMNGIWQWAGSRSEAMVDVRVDHDSGTISYVVDSRGPWDGVHPPDLPHVEVIGGFCKGAELRLYAQLCYSNDRLSLEGPLRWQA